VLVAPLHLAVADERDRVAALVHEPVVAAAERDEVVEVGFAATD